MTGAQQQPTEPAWEFYDLEKDPKEVHNAYNDPEYRPMIEEMKAELMKLRSQIGDTDENRPVMQEIIKDHWN